MDNHKDIKAAIGWNRINLEFVGIWPEPTTSESRLSKYKFLVPTLFIFIFVSAPQSVNLFLLNGNLELITENLCVANIPATTAALKILFTRYYREDLKPVIKSFYDDWNCIKTEEERTTMLNSAKLSRNISTWCTVLSQVMVTVYLTLRAVKVANSDRYEENEDRLVIYPGYFPYSVRNIPTLVLTNLAQVYAAYCAVCSYTGVDAFIVMLVLHMCGQFKNLRRRLERMMDTKNENGDVGDVQKDITWIVERHQHLNWMAGETDNSFNILMLIQMLFCTMELCFQGFMFFNVILHSDQGIFNLTFLFFVLFIIFLIVHVYLYCYVGELLLVQSTGMAISAYNASWFNASPREARCLLFVMNRCTRPLCLSAGKFGTFSLELFSTILKTAMGYLSVLLTVSNDD